jgi:subtilase family serine protease
MIFKKRRQFLQISFLIALFLLTVSSAQAAYRFANYQGRPPIHTFGAVKTSPAGLTPATVKAIYNLPASGGRGTIAIIEAYDDPTLENDLRVFNIQFKLPPCTFKNGCLIKHSIGQTKADAGWALETSLDVEWAHALAPQAKILVVAAKTPSGQNLLDAIDYARRQPGVVAISMSWGGAEFSDELSLDRHFLDPNKKITFFASSGDDGAGVSWPAVSPNVVAVGGTYVSLNAQGKLRSETAWEGSGGGVSIYEPEPAYQLEYNILKVNKHRAIPDVSFAADPRSGFSVYCSTGRSKGWFVLGGTSAGAPQWAAIKALGLAADNNRFYQDKASTASSKYFRDIKSGQNGDCGYYCEARRHYDFVTGLGSPVAFKF